MCEKEERVKQKERPRGKRARKTKIRKEHRKWEPNRGKGETAAISTTGDPILDAPCRTWFASPGFTTSGRNTALHQKGLDMDMGWDGGRGLGWALGGAMVCLGNNPGGMSRWGQVGRREKAKRA